MSEQPKVLTAPQGDLLAMSLFTNAIHAIQAGVEDFVVGADDEGRLKSAIRNVKWTPVFGPAAKVDGSDLDLKS